MRGFVIFSRDQEDGMSVDFRAEGQALPAGSTVLELVICAGEELVRTKIHGFANDSQEGKIIAEVRASAIAELEIWGWVDAGPPEIL